MLRNRMKPMLALAVLVLVAVMGIVIGGSVWAETINYTVSGWGPNQYPSDTTIGPEGCVWGVDGYPGDTLGMVTYTGTLDLTPGTYELKINTFEWTIDYTYGGTETDCGNWSDVLHNITAVRSISFSGGPSGSLGQTMVLTNKWDNDYVTIDEGGTASFTVGGYQVDVTPLRVDQFWGTNFSGGNPWTQPGVDIVAKFVVTKLPLISCPGNITQSNDPSTCGAVVTWSATATGDPTPTVSCTPGSGSTFAVGTTTVTCTATNTCGTDTCSFDVTVNDNENPTISCPAAVTHTADPGKCYALASNVSLGTPTTSDNCGVDTVTNDAPVQFPVGDTTVTWTVKDIHGNSNTCTQTVTITDDENPVITCPGDITQANDAGVCGATVDPGTATATDNCSATVAGVRSDGLALNAVYPVGTTTITWTATDPAGNTDSCVQTIMVNAPPVAQDDSAATNEDMPVTISVLLNDADPDGDSLVIESSTQPLHGATARSGTSIIYTPTPNFSGTDTFTYTISDGNGGTATATVTATVTAVNDAPVANDDSDTTPEDTPVTTNVVANDTDVDGTVVASAVAIVSGPSNGSILNNGDDTVTYTPNANFNGSDIYTYTVQDSDGATSNVATVTITVGSVNDLPIANDDLVLTDEDTPVPIEVTLNDDDPDGTIDPTMIMINDAPGSGTVQVARDGTITYSPAPDFSGIDLFTYTVDDNKGATSNVATVVVTVVEVNDPPIAEDDLATTEAGVPVSIAVLINDTDPDGSLIPGTVTTLSEPESGTATVNRDGTITYTSVDGLVGTDQFTYTVEDDQDAISNEATVTVEVLEVAGAAGGDGELATQEPMSSVRFLKRDTDDISWFVLAEPEKKDGSYYILAVDSTVLEELALSADIQPTETRAGARLEVGLEVTQEERRAYGWPWVRVTQPELAEAEAAGGAGAAAEQGAGFTFSGRYTNGVYWLGIDTAKLLPGRHNVWVVYGAGKTVLVPIEVLP